MPMSGNLFTNLKLSIAITIFYDKFKDDLAIQRKYSTALTGVVLALFSLLEVLVAAVNTDLGVIYAVSR